MQKRHLNKEGLGALGVSLTMLCLIVFIPLGTGKLLRLISGFPPPGNAWIVGFVTLFGIMISLSIIYGLARVLVSLFNWIFPVKEESAHDK